MKFPLLLDNAEEGFTLYWVVTNYYLLQDPLVTDIACAALNGLKMGDKTLTVRRATSRYVFIQRLGNPMTEDWKFVRHAIFLLESFLNPVSPPPLCFSWVGSSWLLCRTSNSV